MGQRKEAAPEILAAEQRLVEGVQGGQVLYVGDALVHGPGEVVPVVEAAQDDAGEVDRLHKDAEQGPLDAHHVPPEGRGTGSSVRPPPRPAPSTAVCLRGTAHPVPASANCKRAAVKNSPLRSLKF